MNISFDFDSTLENPNIQNVAQVLKLHGNRVIVITSRWAHHDNSDLFEVTQRLGITEIFFTNGESKVAAIEENFISLHFDDCPFEAEEIGFQCPVVLVEPFNA